MSDASGAGRACISIQAFTFFDLVRYPRMGILCPLSLFFEEHFTVHILRLIVRPQANYCSMKLASVPIYSRAKYSSATSALFDKSLIEYPNA